MTKIYHSKIKTQKTQWQIIMSIPNKTFHNSSYNSVLKMSIIKRFIDLLEDIEYNELIPIDEVKKNE